MRSINSLTRTLTVALAPLALGLALAACGGEVASSPDPLALSATPVEDVSGPVVSSSPPMPVDGEAPLPELEPYIDGPERLTELETDFGDGGAELPIAEARDTITLFVRHGETLVGLADHAGSTSEDIAGLNHIDVSEPLRAGDPIVIPVDAVDADTVRARRDEVLARRVDRYLRGRGGSLGTETHRVRTGQTGWSIARDVADVPLWVLAAYNPEADLDRLRIGDRLMVPVLTETVVEAEPDIEGLSDGVVGGASGLTAP